MAKKFFKTTNEMQRNISKNAINIASNIGGGLAYRYLRNKLSEKTTDTAKKEAIKQTVTIGSLIGGAAGVIAFNNDTLQSVSMGALTVAGVDFISKTFGATAEQYFGTQTKKLGELGELPVQTIEDQKLVALPNYNSIENVLEEITKENLSGEIEENTETNQENKIIELFD